jgi:spore coat polysaccharide biosynthesis protein SpsF
VVRVCGDNPLTDPAVIDRCVETFKGLSVDYLIPEGLPLGTFPELMNIDALDQAWNNTTDPYDREHVTSYISSRPQDFKQYKLKWEPAQWIFPKLTVDTENDFQLVNTIVSRFKDPTLLTLDNLKR